MQVIAEKDFEWAMDDGCDIHPTLTCHLANDCAICLTEYKVGDVVFRSRSW